MAGTVRQIPRRTRAPEFTADAMLTPVEREAHYAQAKKNSTRIGDEAELRLQAAFSIGSDD
jgi:hypothetical protein